MRKIPHTIHEILVALDCLPAKQHKCAECPFNPHPGMEWPYGCTKGQHDIVREIKMALFYSERAVEWWEDLRQHITIMGDSGGFATQKEVCAHLLKYMDAVETCNRELE